MELAQLASYLKRPDIIRTILRGYHGGYSLGVITVAGGEAGGRKLALLLRVQDPNPTGFQEVIQVEGQEIPIIVEGGFTKPRPLTS